MKYKIIKIKSSFDLLRIIEFLKLGMRMNNLWAYKVLKTILIKNRKKNLYGFAIENNNIIYGAVLTFFQGSINDGLGNFKDIYNISTFYVEKTFRGIPSILLIKELIESLKECILTNYTASEKVQKILISLGFNYMDSYNYRSNSLSIDTFFILKKLKIDTLKLINFNSLKLFKPNFYSEEILNYLTINSNGLEIIGIISHKRLGVFKLPFFVILWSSDESYLYKNLCKIKNYLFYKHHCLGLQIYSEKFINLNRFKGLIRKSNFLIKSPIKLEYIPPLGTEFEAIL